MLRTISSRIFPQCNLEPTLRRVSFASIRHMSSTSNNEQSIARYLGYETIPLKYTVEHADQSTGETSRGKLVLVHGLFGSKQNFRSIAKRFAKDLHMDCYSIDLRNHGDSPHRKEMTYPAMAADLYRFLEQISVDSPSPISLLGHSLGGKVIMSLALHPALHLPNSSISPVKHLIVEDIAPIKGRLSREFEGYARAIEDMSLDNSIKTRKDADKKLAKIESDVTVRQFLLTNLVATSPNTPPTFRVPPQIIIDSLSELGDFPFSPDQLMSEEDTREIGKLLGDSARTDIPDAFDGKGVAFNGKTLIMKGQKSPYIKDSALPVFDAFFPNNRLAHFETGHWIHAEDIKGFVRVVEDFIQDKFSFS